MGSTGRPGLQPRSLSAALAELGAKAFDNSNIKR
jgi:hypothetical protein